MPSNWTGFAAVIKTGLYIHPVLQRLEGTNPATVGTVFSRFLLSLYPAECMSSPSDSVIDKYADNTVLTGLITDADDSQQGWEIDSFAQMDKSIYLKLLGRKKEMIVEFRRRSDQPEPIFIDGESIRSRVVIVSISVSIFNNTPSWKQSINSLLYTYKEGPLCLLCLRKLEPVCVTQQRSQLLYYSVLSSVLTFRLSSWSRDISRRTEGVIVIDNIIRKTRGEHKTGLTCCWTDKLNEIMGHVTYPRRQAFEDRRI